jgi:hypothetical protein
MSEDLKNGISAEAALGLDKDADVSSKPKNRRKKKVS